MDLSRVPGVSAEWRASLEAAGVGTAAALARATGLAALAERTGIPEERLEGLREAARRALLSRLRDAGVASEADLLAAEPGDLASRAGLQREDVEWLQAAAREAVAGLPPRRVTLRPGNALARVRLDEDVHEGVPLRALGEAEAPGPTLAALASNVILLRPGSEQAVARIQGVVHEALPLYAEGSAGEVAVRVAQVRRAEDGPGKKKWGLFRRG